ncbi:hypothetical protein [Micromonospora sp. NPDC005299]|uniref:hypothetical protein n=1 Tax=Micromonospora sp. NPDC005299 TaxID=3364231 RepID=UPI003678BE7B
MTLLFAGGALAVAGITYRDQQEINRSQLQLAKLERQRYERRYASRVAYWWEITPWGPSGPPRLKVQNRSPAPITNLALVALPELDSVQGQTRAYEFLVDAPPCSILTVELPEASEDLKLWSQSSVSLTLRFHDPVDAWLLTPAGLKQVTKETLLKAYGGRSPVMTAALPPKESPESAGDCGEGG